ncbi:HNH endonuclease signature motif containing protein [Micromonospora coerulea]|uniref:HNH endonuclease signature motif containing protein n=1 Tax=Micromonospora coerulea TaxID=47856 RepID=UPI001F36A4C1|nr:HNH endonuclease signature motif containing protein [Micromonospora veneta]
MATVKQRFLSKVAPPNEQGCMLWLAARQGDGYGHFKVAGRMVRAHRFGYEMWVGPIPNGLHLDHLCRVRSCVAPGHLEPVTNRENILRGEAPTARQSRQTHCRNGHPLAGDNLVRSAAARGQRVCRTCRLAWRRERRTSLKRVA